MALIVCHECNKEMSDTADACPHCGAKRPKRRIWPWIVGTPIALAVAFTIFGAIVGNNPEAQAAAQDRNAIKYCWQQQSSPSMDPETQRFAASACQRMERDFRAKYRTDP